MKTILSIIGGCAALWLFYQYMFVWSPRRHMREAIAETNAILGYRQGYAPPRPRATPHEHQHTQKASGVLTTGSTGESYPGISTALEIRRNRKAVRRNPERMARVPHA